MKSVKYKKFELFIPDRYCTKNLFARFASNSYEKCEDIFLRKICNDKQYVLELGSGLGYATSIMATMCKHVIAVEANPELELSLQKTIQANGFQNVTYVNKFISNTKKDIKFNTYDLVVAGSADRMDNAAQWGKTKKEYTLQCIHIDNIPNIHLVNTLVLDIEGGELNFLKENLKFLQQCDTALIELHESMMFRGFVKQCLKVLKDSKFVLKENFKNKFIYLTK
jgi:FkbM family methyltransferase